MYDFYFGSKEDIAKDETKFLIAIKRMMPRWVNSLPDSEYLALAKIMDDQGKNVKKGGDDTLYAGTSGTVSFNRRKVKRFDGHLKERKFINVMA